MQPTNIWREGIKYIRQAGTLGGATKENKMLAPILRG